MGPDKLFRMTAENCNIFFILRLDSSFKAFFSGENENLHEMPSLIRMDCIINVLADAFYANMSKPKIQSSCTRAG